MADPQFIEFSSQIIFTFGKIILFILILKVITDLLIRWIRPKIVGSQRESFVFDKLFANLDPEHYKVLNDVLLPSTGNTKTTQIDHIVVSNYGIFCIETKAYQGWIFGNTNQEQWTQVIYRYKKKFYNPLRQNFAHIKAIENLLRPRLKKSIISLIAFPNADKLKISGTDCVGYARDIVHKIESYTEQIYSDVERDEIYNLLAAADIIDQEARDLHRQEVRSLK